MIDCLQLRQNEHEKILVDIFDTDQNSGFVLGGDSSFLVIHVFDGMRMQLHYVRCRIRLLSDLLIIYDRSYSEVHQNL